jgi:hypothetical protein
VAAPRATRFEGLRRAPDPPVKRVDQGRRVSALGLAAPQGFEGGFTGATLAKQTTRKVVGGVPEAEVLLQLPELASEPGLEPYAAAVPPGQPGAASGSSG